MRAATFFVGMGAVKDQKANTTLTKLFLNGNRVGDAGAAALADALKATVLTYMKCVFGACVRCHRKCSFTESSAQWASSTFLAVRVPVFCVIYLVSCLKTLTQVMWRRVRIVLHYLTSELKRCSSPLARAKLRCATTSRHQESGGTLKITTVLWFDKVTWRSRTWHNAARKQAGLQTHTICCGPTAGDTTARNVQ